MAINFLKPKISIQELKILVIDMKHNDSCTDYLFKYQQEFYGHYAAICLQLTEEQSLRNYMSLSKYEEIHEEIKNEKELGLIFSKDRFSVLQFKLALLIDDLITLLTDYGLEDRSIGDIDIIFGS